MAVKARITVGAHPDPPRPTRVAGRRAIVLTPSRSKPDVVYQVAVLAFAPADHGARLAHVKPHGALYNQAAVDNPGHHQRWRGCWRELVFVGAASALRRAAQAEGLRFAAEAFADRSYARDGTLVPRGRAGAVITDTAAAAARAVGIARDGRVAAEDGSEIALEADTICLYGDTPGAVEHARAVRAALEAAGIVVRAFAA